MNRNGSRNRNPSGLFDEDLPDAPDNPEFEEIFTTAEQDKIAVRFEVGIARTQLADIAQIRATKQASRDCAQRFRDAAKKRETVSTIGDAKQSRDESRRRRERRAGR